jgi:hypothetical protein
MHSRAHDCYLIIRGSSDLRYESPTHALCLALAR